MKIKVEPSGVAFDIVGDANIPGCDYQEFLKSGITSTGTDQVENITSTDVLPNGVGLCVLATDYSVSSGQVKFSIKSTAWTDAYLTFGEPKGNPTLKRVKTVVEENASGTNIPVDAADALFSQLMGTGLKYDPDATAPPNIWNLYSPGYSSECPGLAKFVSVHFQMLGLDAGSISFCRATPNGGYEGINPEPTVYTRSSKNGSGNHTANTNHDSVHD